MIKNGMIKNFCSAVASGLLIGIGGTAYLAVSDAVLGAFLFGIGLFCILSMNLRLFTGMVCRIPENKPKFLLTLVVVWLGNFTGTYLFTALIRLTRMSSIEVRAEQISNAKINDSLLSVFILACFCGILMYLAVEGYKRIESPAGKYIAVFLCVGVFILCGFEHCIANMFFYSMGDVWSPQAFLSLAVISVGNGVGGNLLPLIRKYIGA